MVGQGVGGAGVGTYGARVGVGGVGGAAIRVLHVAPVQPALQVHLQVYLYENKLIFRRVDDF